MQTSNAHMSRGGSKSSKWTLKEEITPSSFRSTSILPIRRICGYDYRLFHSIFPYYSITHNTRQRTTWASRQTSSGTNHSVGLREIGISLRKARTTSKQAISNFLASSGWEERVPRKAASTSPPTPWPLD